MAAEPNIGMDREDLKALLRLSKKDPMNCAVAGNANDPSLAFILLHKVKAPKAVSQQLEKENPKNFNLRWGTARVDADLDPKLVTFALNKNVTGLAKKLKKSLKGTGYTKVRIEFEDGSPADADLGEEDGAAPAAPPGAAEPAPAPAPAATASAEPPAPAAPSGVAEPAPAPTASASAAPSASTTPSGAAEAAPAQAETASTEPPAPDAAPAPADPAVIAARQKSALVWTATRTKIRTEVEKLKAEILKTYASTAMVAEIERAFAARIQPVVANFDEALDAKLAELNAAADPDAQARLATEARSIVARYAQFAASDPLIKELDGNPFVPLAIQATVLNTAKALSTTLR